MRAAALYGMLIGAGSVVFTQALPQPAGAVVFWALMTLQLARGAVVVWRRIGLHVTTIALTICAATQASLAILAAAGQVYPAVPRAWWFLVLVVGLIALAFLFIDSKLHPAEWQRWRQHQANATLWDLIRCRHIPDLRGERGSA